jgi:hypothetical protein
MTRPTNDNNNTNASETPIVHRFRDAYDRLSAEMDAVPHGELESVNVDVPKAITTVLGAMPEVAALRPRVVAELPKFDIAKFDRLEDYALALGHAQAVYLAASEPQEALPELAEQAFKTREQLASDAAALSNRGFIDGKKLAELKGGTGYRAVAFDLFALVTMLREKWSVISSKTALSPAELDSAEKLADRIITAVGVREQAPAIVGEASEKRQRAFTLFVNAYDDVRRAVAFLRWHEADGETIAPSIYGGRNGSRRKSNGDDPIPTTDTPASPAPVANGSVSPAAAVEPPGTGLPGSNPLLSG